MPSFPIKLARCDSAVRTEIAIAPAACFAVFPSAMSRNIWRSRSLSLGPASVLRAFAAGIGGAHVDRTGSNVADRLHQIVHTLRLHHEPMHPDPQTLEHKVVFGLSGEQ